MKRTKFIFTHHRECAGIGGAEEVTESTGRCIGYLPIHVLKMGELNIELIVDIPHGKGTKCVRMYPFIFHNQCVVLRIG